MRVLLAVLIAASLLLPVKACSTSEEGVELARVAPSLLDRPNTTPHFTHAPPSTVVLITVDALRADILGAYGSSWQVTPQLDSFAAQSLSFVQAYSPSAWTRSSLASLFTARFPGGHSVLGREDILSPEALTLAEVIKANVPEVWSFAVLTNPGNTGPAAGLMQGFDHFARPDPPILRSHPQDRFRKMSAEAVTKFALEQFDRAKNREASRIFAYIHYIDPHDPYIPNPGSLSLPEPPGRFSGSRRDLAAIELLGLPQLRPDDILRLEYLYAAEVRLFDLWFGRLIEGLRERGILDKSLIVVTADHGEAFWEHGTRGHGKSLYEEEIRVPLLIRLPGKQSAEGRQIKVPVSLADVAPTILHALRIPAPRQFQGQSLARFLTHTDSSPARNQVFSELHFNPKVGKVALRAGRYKLIKTFFAATDDGQTPDPVFELYDLRQDPDEKKDLAVVAPQSEALGQLARLIHEWQMLVQADALDRVVKAHEELSPETLRALRSLGYIR